MTTDAVTCPNGHENGPSTTSCATCGAEVAPGAAATTVSSERRPIMSPTAVFAIAAFIAIAAAIATGGAIVLFG